MAKLTAWLVTLIGILLIPPIMNWINGMGATLWSWLIAIIVLIIGISKLIRNYSYSK